MRLDKYLAETAQCTRSEAKTLLSRGRVTVNGAVCKKGDTQLREGDSVAVDGAPLAYQQFVYLMLNKPEGVVSASTDKRDTTVVDLIGDAYPRRELFPAGRKQLPPGVGIPDQIHYGGIPLVGGSAHHALRLVEHQVDELLVSKRRTVHRHAVPFPELGVPLFAHRAVHRHPSPAQQGLCLAPGALRRLGQIFV